MNNMIINADDVGISPGCNKAVEEACAVGAVNRVSLFANSQYLNDAIVSIARAFPEVSCGAHLDLTYGRSLTNHPLLAKSGILNSSYLSLLIKSHFNPAFRQAVEKEFEAQIDHLLAQNIILSHIDSHRHVHMIRPIFKIVKRLAEKYKIEKIRVPNESLWFSAFKTGSFRKVTVGGIGKSLFLKALSLVSGARQETPFFSLLFSGMIDRSMIESVMEKVAGPIEVMVHIGLPEMDANARFSKKLEGDYWRSPRRLTEYDACMAANRKRNTNET